MTTTEGGVRDNMQRVETALNMSADNRNVTPLICSFFSRDGS